MKYLSAITPKGNSSYSFTSAAEADARASALDDAGCTRCMDCTGCTGCMDCTGCRDCTDCTGCTGCRDCTGCTRCTRCTGCTDCMDCTGCMDCTRCTDCTGCMDCTRCTDSVITAGRPNGWPCYGWLKNDMLVIHCGCHRKTYADAIAYWTGKPHRTEVLAAVEYIAAIARLRGWTV